MAPVASSLTDEASELQAELAQAKTELEASRRENAELSREIDELSSKNAELVSIISRSARVSASRCPSNLADRRDVLCRRRNPNLALIRRLPSLR